MAVVIDSEVPPAGLAIRASTRIAAPFLAESDRWLLWFPVSLAAGIAVYFGLPSEPPLWSGLAAVGVLCAAAAMRRCRPASLLILALIGAATLGFTAAQWRTYLVAAAVLASDDQWVDLSGQVLDVEIDSPGSRITLDHVSI